MPPFTRLPFCCIDRLIGSAEPSFERLCESKDRRPKMGQKSILRKTSHVQPSHPKPISVERACYGSKEITHARRRTNRPHRACKCRNSDSDNSPPRQTSDHPRLLPMSTRPNRKRQTPGSDAAAGTSGIHRDPISSGAGVLRVANRTQSLVRPDLWREIIRPPARRGDAKPGAP
jgi:hypothetical protein